MTADGPNAARDRPAGGEGGPTPKLAARSLAGGVLMGLANLVPGISGGTMLLATGIYTRFIDAVSEVTALDFRLPSLTVLGGVAGAAGLTIALLAGVVKDLVVDHRWLMYSLFIGLTLGGLPVIWRLIRQAEARSRAKSRTGVWLGAAAGLAGMGALAWAQAAGAAGGAERGGVLFMVLAGAAGAAAMILPGVSGGYLFLVLGVYVPVLAGIEAFVGALKGGDLAAAVDPALRVLLPVAVGIAIALVAVSNLLKMLLRRFERPTLGVLMGLLGGAVVGLWPFQRGVPPAVGDLFRGRVVTAESLPEILAEAERFPTEFFAPSGGQVLGSLLLVAAGVAITMLIGLLGRDGDHAG